MAHHVLARIISATEVLPLHYRVTLHCPQVAYDAKPGQFVHILIDSELELSDPFLRRPFNIINVGNKNIEILLKVVGKGTRILSRLAKAGDKLDILGPLGKGFVIIENLKSPLLIAEDIGVTALMLLTKELLRNKTVQQVRFLISAPTEQEILCVQQLRKLGCDISIATEDGSIGYHGSVTDLLENILSRRANTTNLHIFASASKPMVKTISQITTRYTIPAQVFLKQRLGCGIGVCKGCVVPIKDPTSSSKHPVTGEPFQYKRVCTDGPVFDAREVIWE